MKWKIAKTGKTTGGSSVFLYKKTDDPPVVLQKDDQ
jgi:hypothetical protein